MGDGDPFVDPGGLCRFLDEHYLGAYVASGGSKLKFVTGRAGAGKTALLAALRRAAGARGYCTASLDAPTVQLGRFDELYRAVMAQVPVDEIVDRLARSVIRALGYGPDEIPAATAFLPWVIAQGRVPESVARDMRIELEQLYRDPNLVDSFAAAFMHLAYGRLRGVPDPEAEAVVAWIRGQPQPRRLYASAHLHRPIDRYSARHMLRSLLFLLRRVAFTGLAVTIDGLDALLDSRKQPDRVQYTKLRRDDTYESLRELIDDAENLPGLFVVAAGSPNLLHHDMAGSIWSYPALGLRVQNEVEAAELNRFADHLDLDRAWETDWPRLRAELAEQWARAARAQGIEPPALDIERFEYAGLMSPVGRIARALRGEGGEAA